MQAKHSRMDAKEPEARHYHAAVGVGNKLYIWGGYNSLKSICSTTLESFDVSSLKWEQPRQVNGSFPDVLQNAAVTSENECSYSYAGLTGNTRLNALYEINLTTLQCREFETNSPSHVPQQTEGCRTVLFKNKLVVYGGYNGQSNTDDLLFFDLDKSEYGI